MPNADRDLLAAARAGDVRSVDLLLARHQQQIFRFGLRMCGNEEEAREVLQETLLAAFRDLRHFRGDAQLSTWLYQIARSFCLKGRRRAVGQPESTESLERAAAKAIPTSEPSPEAHADAREISQVLQAAILTLPEKYREALILRDVEGLSAEEAAKVVGIEVGALKSRLHRARNDLRERLTAVFDEDQELRRAAPCPELARELASVDTEEIDQAACAQIDEHLKQCPRCAAAGDALQRTVSFCKQIPGGDVPAPIQAAVRAALLAARSGPLANRA